MIKMMNVSPFFIFILTVLLVCTCVHAEFLDTSLPTQQISARTDELHEKPDCSLSGAFVHVVWTSWHHEFDSEISYRRSSDGGVQWDNVSFLSGTSSTAVDPAVAASGTYVHVIWRDSVDEFPVVYYRRSDDNGESWNDPTILIENQSRKTNLYNVDVVSNESYVYVVWKDYRTGSSEVFFKRSEDNGSTWSSDMRLTRDYTPSYEPRLFVLGPYLYIVYQDGGTTPEVSVLRSEDFGRTWTEKIHVTDTGKASEMPQVFAVDSVVYLVWQDERFGDPRIFFTKSDDYGVSWDEEQVLSVGTDPVFNPQIYCFKTQVWVFWQRVVNDEIDVFGTVSEDGGETWSDVDVMLGDMDVYDVRVVGVESEIRMVWQWYMEPTIGCIWYGGLSDHSSVVVDPAISDEAPSFLFVPTVVSMFMVFIFIRYLRKT